MLGWILGCATPVPPTFEEALRQRDLDAVAGWLPHRGVRRWLSLQGPTDHVRLDVLPVDLLGSTVWLEAQLVAEPGRWEEDRLPLGSLLVTPDGWLPMQAWSTIHEITATVDIAPPLVAGEATLRVDGRHGVVAFALHGSPAYGEEDRPPAIELVEVTQEGVPCPWFGWNHEWVVGLPFPDADATIHLRWRYLPHPSRYDILEPERVELNGLSDWMPTPHFRALVPIDLELNGIDGLEVRSAEQGGRTVGSTVFAAAAWPGSTVEVGPMVVDVSTAPDHEADTVRRLLAIFEVLKPLVPSERWPERLLITETRDGRPATSPRGFVVLPFPYVDRLPWVTAHELVHQAAGPPPLGHVHGAPFPMEEALAEYLALRTGSADEALAWRRQLRAQLAETPAAGERPMLDVAGPGEYRYARGGLLFEALEVQIGRDVMDDVLREAFRGTMFDWFDLLDAVAARDPATGRWLSAWLEAPLLPELAVRETADGGVELVDHANTDLPGTIEVVATHPAFGPEAPLQIALDRLPVRLESRAGATWAIDPEVRWPSRVR